MKKLLKREVPLWVQALLCLFGVVLSVAHIAICWSNNQSAPPSTWMALFFTATGLVVNLWEYRKQRLAQREHQATPPPAEESAL
ncbi:hypothetical protein [Nocardiopsis sp. FIRDI 009]|uniref:hypothetical protein n=1 Tax=Nocardiopsis sp. FIRDI 009 TaxID=714197 RepID=UPI000E23A5B4|nr:hypothetical protein [Nocardiopsis sp. FIRDI 009]